MSTAAQMKANRENAQKSSGPVTVEGKAASSQNNHRHGFRGAFNVLDCESQADFDALLTGLIEEHQPSTLTEEILVQRMAQHYWLSERARHLQNSVINTDEMPLDHLAKEMGLWLRYQTSNDRSFHKCLNELLKLRAERRKAQIGFERQKQQQADQIIKEQATEAKTRLTNAKAEAVELDTAIKATVEAPLPGHTPIDFNDLKDVISHAIRELVTRKELQQAA